ncbi:MAG: cupredoxin domain-containing protein, partial [Actinobacteria bacterium]|nr:cupredoxin domain-containing protein [Actinomycetota bacterium]
IIVVLVLLGLGVLFFALRPGSSTSGDEPRERTYEVAIKDGVMSPAEIDVEEGDQVTLRLTSDAPVEV